jgi:hypothetical protein
MDIDMNMSQKRTEKKKVVEKQSVPTAVGAFEYELELPSDGKIYDKKVVIKSMTAREEDILSNASFIRKGTVFRELLKSIIVHSDVSIDNMLAGDRDYILLNARIDAYGSDYPVDVDCPQCEQSSKINVDLSEIEGVKLDLIPVEPNQNLFGFTTSSGVDIIFKFWTVADQTRFDKYTANVKNLPRVGMVTHKLFEQIVAIDGEEDRQTVKDLIMKMRARDSMEIRKYINQYAPTVDMRLASMQCNNCNYSQEVDVPLVESFFWPELELER